MMMNSAKLQAYLDAMDQEIYFSGIRAHHQNGVAKSLVHTIIKRARIMLLHAILHWPNEVDLDLFSIHHGPGSLPMEPHA
jgi:hypothetical protein